MGAKEKNVFVSYLDLLGVRHTDTYSSQYFNEHPQKYNLYGLSKMLSDYGIENAATRIDDRENDLFNIELPFIAHIGSDFVVVHKVESDKVHYLWNRKKISVPVSKFIPAWSGVIFLAKTLPGSCEPDYVSHRKKDLLIVAQQSVLAVAGILIFGLAYIHHSLFTSLGITSLLFVNLLSGFIQPVFAGFDPQSNTLNFINFYWPTHSRQYHVTSNNHVVEYQGKIIFFEPQNPRIYELTVDSASLRYDINVGNKVHPEDFWDIKDLTWDEIVEKNIWKRQVQEIREKGYIDNIMFFSEAPETILLKFSSTGKDTYQGTYALINKESRSSVLIDKIAFDSHFFWKPGNMYSRSDGIVIIPIPADILLESEEGEIRKSFPNLLEDDNPILCIAKLR